MLQWMNERRSKKSCTTFPWLETEGNDNDTALGRMITPGAMGFRAKLPLHYIHSAVVLEKSSDVCRTFVLATESVGQTEGNDNDVSGTGWNEYRQSYLFPGQTAITLYS